MRKRSTRRWPAPSETDWDAPDVLFLDTTAAQMETSRYIAGPTQKPMDPLEWGTHGESGATSLKIRRAGAPAALRYRKSHQRDSETARLFCDRRRGGAPKPGHRGGQIPRSRPSTSPGRRNGYNISWPISGYFQKMCTHSGGIPR